MDELTDSAVRFKRRIPIGDNQGVEYPKEAAGVITSSDMDSEFGEDSKSLEDAQSEAANLSLPNAGKQNSEY